MREDVQDSVPLNNGRLSGERAFRKSFYLKQNCSLLRVHYFYSEYSVVDVRKWLLFEQASRSRSGCQSLQVVTAA